jgi:TonB-dependent receptor
MFAVLSLPASLAAHEQERGGVSGRITDGVSGAPLIGADVMLEGTAFSAATDPTGAFRLIGVPAGRYELLVLYLGHKDERATVEVVPGRTVAVEVKLAPAQFSETVQVIADSIGEGQASALNQQRTAVNITNIVSADQIGAFPDPNAAEAASRVPGVSIARDQGEGRYVLVRGTEPRLNAMMIDGERIPAPEGDVRQVQLDAVPADQLQSIEVSKAVTPDMDADSIGGAVNLVTRQAVAKPTALFTLAGGFNALQRDYGQSQFGATLGRRVGRAGILIGGSASSLARGSENFEAQYAAGGLTDLQLRDYIISRKRYGFNASADVRLSNSGALMLKGIFNEFKDYEINNRKRYRPSNGRIEQVLKNRNQNDHIRSLAASGQHLVNGSTAIDYRLAWAESEEDQPDRLDTVFRQTGITFAPNVSASSINPENIQPNPSRDDSTTARLNNWSLQVFDSTDRDVTGAFNVRMPIGGGSARAQFFKVGAKIKDKHKLRSADTTIGTPVGVVLFPELQNTSFDNSRFMNFFPAGYVKFPGTDADRSRAMFNSLPAANRVIDRSLDAQDYDASERLVAAYAMGEFYVGDKWLVLPGVRYESTRVDYRGNEVRYNAAGQYLSTRPLSDEASHGHILPGLHVRYAIDDRTNVRAAYTTTLARPNYYDLVPYELVRQDSHSIARGNAALTATLSSNADFLVEHYYRSVGVISGGVFYKHLTDYIFPFRTQTQAFGELYNITQPQNGDTATLWGAEIAFQNQLRSLPAPFNGLGVYANYTWTGSSTQFPDHDGESTLPGQSTHIGNVAISYEKSGFSGRVSWNFHGKYIDAVGAASAEDVYYDNHVQLDVNLSQRITRNIRGFVDALNLTNAPLRYYLGSSNRPIQQEYYRWWAMFGVKVNF